MTSSSAISSAVRQVSPWIFAVIPHNGRLVDLAANHGGIADISFADG